MRNYMKAAYDLFDEWVNEPNYSKQMLNFLVRQLTDDVHWTENNIGKVDKELLIELGKRLERKGEMK